MSRLGGGFAAKGAHFRWHVREPLPYKLVLVDEFDHLSVQTVEIGVSFFEDYTLGAVASWYFTLDRDEVLGYDTAFFVEVFLVADHL